MIGFGFECGLNIGSSVAVRVSSWLFDSWLCCIYRLTLAGWCGLVLVCGCLWMFVDVCGCLWMFVDEAWDVPGGPSTVSWRRRNVRD